MKGLASATRELPRTHVPVVDVRLQVALGQVSALAALHHAAHVQRATLALLNPLHRVCAAVDDQTETTKVVKSKREIRKGNMIQQHKKT